MDMLLKIVPMLFVLFSSQWSIASVPIPEKYLGEWSVTLERQSGFPWWLEVKYPVNLAIKENNSCTFEDQSGFICELKQIFYDPQEDLIVIRHCGIKKHSEAFDILHVIKYDNGKIIGEVKTYKTLFRWIGQKKRDVLK